jgi:hypothetical protein
MTESIFCIQFSPVMRTSFFTSGNSPQNVKNTVVSRPIAAPVVDRISVGHTWSRSPDQAKMTSLSCPWPSPSEATAASSTGSVCSAI